jgi:hypothetical protein
MTTTSPTETRPEIRTLCTLMGATTFARCAHVLCHERNIAVLEAVRLIEFARTLCDDPGCDCRREGR